MPGDLIRQAIVKIALQHEESKIKVPDLAPITAAEKQATEQIKSEAQAQTNARAHARLLEIAQHEGYYRALRQMMQQEADEGGRLISKQRDEQHRAFAAAAEMQDQQDARLKSARQGWLQIAESAAQFGRAAVLATANTDSDMKELLTTVARVQSAFDVIQGAQKGIEGIGQAFGASEASIAAVGARIGAVGGYATAAAAAVYLLYQGVRDLTGANQAASLEAANAAEAAKPGGGRKLSGDALERAQRGFFERAIYATADWIANEVFDPFGTGSNAKRAADPDLAMKNLMQQEESRQTEALRGRIAGFGSKFARADVGRDQMGSTEKIRDINAEIARLKKQIREDEGVADDTAIIEKKEALQKRIAQLQQEALKAVREEGQELENNLQKQRAAVDALHAMVEAENAKARSIEEQVGSLNSLQRAELEAIAGRIQSGTASEIDVTRAAQLAPDIYGARAKRDARQRGAGLAGRLFEQEFGVGINAGRNEAQGQLDRAEEGADDRTEEVSQIAGKIAEADRKYHTALMDALTAIEAARNAHAEDAKNHGRAAAPNVQ